MRSISSQSHLIYLFAGGGTGGHLYPAVAIAQNLAQLQPQAQMHFTGTRKGLECRVIPEMGYRLHIIAVRGFARGRVLVNLTVPLRLLWSFWQCVRIVHALKPAAVIGTGGYVSGPMLFTAALMQVPTLIQEQNSYPGVTTRLLARAVDQVHLSFPESEVFFADKAKLRISGNPVRDMHVAHSPEEARQVFGLAPQRWTLLVFGGSQGARVINEKVLHMLDVLMAEPKVQLIWAIGRWKLELAEAAAARYPGRICVKEYISEMPVAYRAANLVLSRAGALTLAEITLCGLASILIPFAQAAGGHQEANAMALKNAGAAKVVLEKDLDTFPLAEVILALLKDIDSRTAMAAAARAASFPDASGQLTRAVLDLTTKARVKEKANR